MSEDKNILSVGRRSSHILVLCRSRRRCCCAEDSSSSDEDLPCCVSSCSKNTFKGRTERKYFRAGVRIVAWTICERLHVLAAPFIATRCDGGLMFKTLAELHSGPFNILLALQATVESLGLITSQCCAPRGVSTLCF